ncbi:capsule biosynthesis protein CapA [uncultured Paracoccus sp.]|uniref:capsule biosynthesis protein n=1 Tax=uncultured Paracoccus sp. TaxID=189685 RepID=UPI00260939A7|nr:capsule biosynthesis protein CapA [uncultured Paracoccus sp.]
MPPQQRVFLLLQGPHGPFFDRLGRLLRSAGSQVWRVGFNAGDEFFWSDRDRFIRHAGDTASWPAHLDSLITRLGVTDLVIYGDVRPVHAAARDAAALHGLVLHVFEEGYLRPYWISYERGGSNGYSDLMDITLPQMRAALRGHESQLSRPPAHWGDMRHHKFYGALYHFMVLAANRRYPLFRTHRDVGVRQEFMLHLRKLLLSPAFMLSRWAAVRAIRRGGFPYVLGLLQLEHDASFIAHSDYKRMRDFTDEVLRAFADAAPPHHHIVFKAHPLEDGRGKVRDAIAETAATLGVSDRVHVVHGGKLARLLAQARSVVTVNSTSAQQALWRGIPVRAMGRAVFDKPQLVSRQSLEEFLRHPDRPNTRAYRDYRDYLLETSQVPGGFYAARSRAHALRVAVDLMLAPDNPYSALASGRGAHRQQIGSDA